MAGTAQKSGKADKGTRHVKSEGGKMINLDDRTKVKGAKKGKHLKEGEVYEVHPETAKRLIRNKQATKYTGGDDLAD